MSLSERHAAELELNRRDRVRNVHRFGQNMLYKTNHDEQILIMRTQCLSAEHVSEADDDQMPEPIKDFYDPRTFTVKEWVSMSGTRNEIIKRFKAFLHTAVNSTDQSTYIDVIQRMCLCLFFLF